MAKPMDHRDNIVVVHVPELRIGDVVCTHGALLRIAAVNYRDDEATNFRTECIGFTLGSYARVDKQFKGWCERGEFNIQGNMLATIATIPQLAY